MTTLKTVTVPVVPTEATTVYTNTTGYSALLKAVDFTNNADGVMTEVPGATDWTFFGSGLYAPQSRDHTDTPVWGMPYPIRLSSNRVMLLWQPHHLHIGHANDFMGNTVLHTQIIEHQTDRFMAGPICDINVPAMATSMYAKPSGMANNGQFCIHGIALTPTKVALGVRQGSAFKLIRLTISGNRLDDLVPEELDLTGAAYFNNTSALAFTLLPVPGNTNKLLVVGNTSAVSVQAYNFPDSGALSNSGALYSTALTSTTHNMAACLHTKIATDNVSIYTIAALSNTTSLNIQLMSYNSATDAFNMIGSVANATVTNVHGLNAGCLSVDTTGNSTVGICEGTNISFYKQAGNVQAAITKVTATLQHSGTKSLHSAYNWGDERVIFVGKANTLICYNSAGVITNMIPASVSTSSQLSTNMYYPFDTRPLYNVCDPATSPSVSISYKSNQYHTRVNPTSATDAGEMYSSDTYMPFGHDYHHNYAWSDVAQCWVIGVGSVIYCVAQDGKVLSEVTLATLYNNGDFNQNQSRIASLEVLPSGKIIFITDPQTAHFSGILGTAWHTNFNAHGKFCYGWVTNPLLSANMLPGVGVSKVPVLLTSACVSADLSIGVDRLNSEFAYATCVVANSNNCIVNIYRYSTDTWAASGLAAVPNRAPNTTNNVGLYPNIRLIQTAPCSSELFAGAWRLVGSNSLSSTPSWHISTTEREWANFASLEISTAIDTNSSARYPLLKGTAKGITVVAQYDSTASKPRILSCPGDRLGSFTGWLPPTTKTELKNCKLTVTSGGYSLSILNSSVDGTGALNTSLRSETYTFKKYGFEPYYTFVSPTGRGVIQSQIKAPYTWQLYGSGIDAVYQSSSVDDAAKMWVYIFGGGNDVAITPREGLALPSVGYGRATDVYFVPNGYSIKLRTDLPNGVSCTLSIVEDV